MKAVRKLILLLNRLRSNEIRFFNMLISYILCTAYKIVACWKLELRQAKNIGVNEAYFHSCFEKSEKHSEACSLVNLEY